MDNLNLLQKIIVFALPLLFAITLHELDGGRVLSSLLPNRFSYWLDKIEPFGFRVLLLLLTTGVLSVIISPFISAIGNLIYSLLGLN